MHRRDEPIPRAIRETPLPRPQQLTAVPSHRLSKRPLTNPRGDKVPTTESGESIRDNKTPCRERLAKVFAQIPTHGIAGHKTAGPDRAFSTIPGNSEQARSRDAHRREGGSSLDFE